MPTQWAQGCFIEKPLSQSTMTFNEQSVKIQVNQSLFTACVNPVILSPATHNRDHCERTMSHGVSGQDAPGKLSDSLKIQFQSSHVKDSWFVR